MVGSVLVLLMYRCIERRGSKNGFCEAIHEFGQGVNKVRSHVVIFRMVYGSRGGTS